MPKVVRVLVPLFLVLWPMVFVAFDVFGAEKERRLVPLLVSGELQGVLLALTWAIGVVDLIRRPHPKWDLTVSHALLLLFLPVGSAVLCIPVHVKATGVISDRYTHLETSTVPGTWQRIDAFRVDHMFGPTTRLYQRHAFSPVLSLVAEHTRCGAHSFHAIDGRTHLVFEATDKGCLEGTESEAADCNEGCKPIALD